MKRKFWIYLVLMLTCGCPVITAQTDAAPATLFQYPQLPDSLTNINARYNYYISHFWDRAPMKSVFSSKPKLAQAFYDFVTPMRFASADTVRSAISRLMNAVADKADHQLYLAQLAEDNLYGDSAEVWIDDYYLAFIRPVISNKRVDKALKARYKVQYDQLRNSRVGRPMAPFAFTDRNGEKQTYFSQPDIATIVFFNDPDCSDCAMARVRLQADVKAAQLLEQGKLKILALSPVDADETWRDSVKDYPESWIVGANPDLDLCVDLRKGTPAFYVLDEQGLLAAKNIDINSILLLLSKI